MKKLFTFLLLIIFSFSSFSQTTKYYNGGNWWTGTGGTGSVTTGPDNSTGLVNFVVETDGLDLSNESNVLFFTVNDGVTMTLSSQLTVNGSFSILGNSFFSIGVDISSTGELLLANNGAVPVIGRYVRYLASSSKLYLTEPPASSDELKRLNPSTSMFGSLIFGEENQTYDFGTDNILINSNISYSTAADGITVKAGGMDVAVDDDVNFSNITFEIQGDFILEEGKVITLNKSGFTLVNSNTSARTYLSPGASLVTNGNSATVNKLTLKSSSSGQAVIVGTGLNSSDLDMEVYLNHTGTTTVGNGEAWRELGTPFDVTVNNVNWSNNIVPDGLGESFDTKVKSENGWIKFYDNSNGTWVSSGTNAKTIDQAFEVWNMGGNTITVSGGDLTSHNSDYSQPLYYVTDQSGNTTNESGWNFVPNPFASYLEIYPVLDQRRGLNVGLITGDAYILTYHNGNYKYWTDSDLYLDSYVDYLSPFQGFWVLAESGINNGVDQFSITTDLQNSGISNSQDLAKGNEVRIDSTKVRLYLRESETSIPDVTRLYFFENNASGRDEFYGNKDVRQLNANANSDIPSVYIEAGGVKLIGKEYLKSDLEENTFSQELNLLGAKAMDLSFEINQNDLDPSFNIYLTDKLTSTTVKLNDGPYNFTHNPSNEANRFEIQITTETLGESEKIETSNIKLVNKGHIVEFKMPSTSAIESVQFVSLNGQVVKTVQAYKGQTEFNVADFNSGVYIAQLKLESGNVASYKFIR